MGLNLNLGMGLGSSAIGPIIIEQWLFGESNPDLVGMKTGLRLARSLLATITNAGSGYSTAPSVTASDGSTWVATVSGGAVTTVVCTGPTVGTTTPTLLFSGGGGSGAAVTVARAAEPTINANSITLGSGGRGNGLSLPFLGLAGQTICMVAKKAVAGSAQMLLSSADSSVATGMAVWKSSSSNNYIARAAGLTGEGTGVNLGSPGSDGDWLFIAITFDGANGRRTLIGPSTTTTTAGTHTPAIIPLALGNANWAGFSSVALEVATCLVFNPLSASEMLTVYAQVKESLAVLPVL
jgi:hypothetical protein